MSQGEHERRERAIFSAFIKASGLPVDASSIRKPPPPAPDILCTVSGDDVAFELVEIVSEMFAKTTRARPRLRQMFDEAYRKLPPEVRATLEFRLGGAPVVRAGFKLDTEAGQWSRLIKPILDTLTERRQAVEPGEFPVWEVPRLRMLSDMSLRGGSDGAELHVSEATLGEDRTLAALQRKLDRHYESDAPIELLAYYDFEPPPRLGPKWRSDVREFLRARLPGSPFRRAWLVDCRSRKVILDCGRDETAVPPPLTRPSLG